jgi:hypothetical protein
LHEPPRFNGGRTDGDRRVDAIAAATGGAGRPASGSRSAMQGRRAPGSSGRCRAGRRPAPRPPCLAQRDSPERWHPVFSASFGTAHGPCSTPEATRAVWGGRPPRHPPGRGGATCSGGCLHHRRGSAMRSGARGGSAAGASRSTGVTGTSTRGSRTAR